MKLTKSEAEILRNYIIKSFGKSMPPEFYTDIVQKYNMGNIDNWILSIEEIQEYGLDPTKQYYAQIEKLLKLMGAEVTKLEVIQFANKYLKNKNE